MSSLNQIKTILSVPSKDRSEKQLKDLAYLLKPIEFLAEHIQKKDFLPLCRDMQLEFYQREAVIFNEGDIGTKFYIILDGDIGIYSKTKRKDGVYKRFYSRYEFVREVAVLHQGQCFGELALQLDCTRTAYALALTPSVLAVISKESFTAVLKHSLDKRMESYLEVLRQQDLLAGFTDQELMYLAAKTIEKSFRVHDTIILEGEVPKGIFFIQSGIVKVVYRFDQRGQPLHDYNDPAQLYDYIPAQHYRPQQSQPPKVISRKSILVGTTMSVDQLGIGTSFCSYEALTMSAMQYSVVSESYGELLVLSQYDIQQQLTPQRYELLLQRSKMYPPAPLMKPDELRQSNRFNEQISAYLIQGSVLRKHTSSRQLPPLLRNPLSASPARALVYARPATPTYNYLTRAPRPKQPETPQETEQQPLLRSILSKRTMGDSSPSPKHVKIRERFNEYY